MRPLWNTLWARGWSRKPAARHRRHQEKRQGFPDRGDQFPRQHPMVHQIEGEDAIIAEFTPMPT
jgi:hypothetical protein